MAIEPSKALCLPMPTYVFVSPKNPELAARIQAGLRMMIQDGSRDKLFWEYHRASIKQSDLAHRRIFRVDNPLLSPETPFERQHLWLDPSTSPEP